MPKRQKTTKDIEPSIMIPVHPWRTGTILATGITGYRADRMPDDPSAAIEDPLERAYRTKDGQFGIPLRAIKSALITAAQFLTGITYGDVKCGLRVIDPATDKPGEDQAVIPFTNGVTPIPRAVQVKTEKGPSVLSHFVEFPPPWQIKATVAYDPTILDATKVGKLFLAAGRNVGWGRDRPGTPGSKGGRGSSGLFDVAGV